MRGRCQEGRTAIALGRLRKFVLLVRGGGGGLSALPPNGGGVGGGVSVSLNRNVETHGASRHPMARVGGGVGKCRRRRRGRGVAVVTNFRSHGGWKSWGFWWIIDIWAENIGRAKIDQPRGNRHNHSAEGDGVGR
jgi:hypothetical protein